MSWKSLDDMDLDGKTVLTRVDINVATRTTLDGWGCAVLTPTN